MIGKEIFHSCLSLCLSCSSKSTNPCLTFAVAANYRTFPPASKPLVKKVKAVGEYTGLAMPRAPFLVKRKWNLGKTIIPASSTTKALALQRLAGQNLMFLLLHLSFQVEVRDTCNFKEFLLRKCISSSLSLLLM